MLLILRAQELLAPTWGSAHADAWALGLYVWFNVVYAVGSYPAGVWSELLGKRRILGLGYLLFSVMCVGFLGRRRHSRIGGAVRNGCALHRLRRRHGRGPGRRFAATRGVRDRLVAVTK